MEKFSHSLMDNNITQSDIDSVVDFLKKNKKKIFTQSTQVKKFEAEWSKWLKTKYSVFVNSGSSANLVTLQIIKILYGSGEDEIRFTYDDGYEKYTTGKKAFEGVINNLERRYLETDSDWTREEIAQYQSDKKCESCNGYRLKDEALCVKINNLHISEVTKKSIFDANEWFKSLENKLDKRQFKIAEHILKEINERLNFLLNVGLNYITLSRESGTLSSGESQRIRLASQIGTGLTRVLYVLDEP